MRGDATVNDDDDDVIFFIVLTTIIVVSNVINAVTVKMIMN